MSDPILLLLLAMLAGTLYLAGTVVYKAYKFDPGQRSKRFFKKNRKNKNHRKVTRISYNNPFVAGAWHQLLIKVNFNIPTAERLVNHLKRKHPGQTDRWYIEKAIHDLDSDRRV